MSACAVCGATEGPFMAMGDDVLCVGEDGQQECYVKAITGIPTRDKRVWGGGRWNKDKATAAVAEKRSKDRGFEKPAKPAKPAGPAGRPADDTRKGGAA